jgi:phage tail protein X
MLITPTQTPTTGTEPPIISGAFWPEIDPEAARNTMRLDGTVTGARLRHALVEAIADVNRQLADWRRGQQAAGNLTLDDVPAEQVDGESEHVAHYRRAVYCLAAANLTERYRSFDSTGAGNKQADELDTTVDDLRRDSRWAISDMLGLGRSTIELL